MKRLLGIQPLAEYRNQSKASSRAPKTTLAPEHRRAAAPSKCRDKTTGRKQESVYNLVLSREYSRYDVIKTIEKALTPHQPRKFTLEHVGYGEAGGFPSGKMMVDDMAFFGIR